MDGRSRNEVSPQLLDLIPKGKEENEEGRSHNKSSSEERELELRLGPPSEYWSLNEHIKNINRQRDESLLSLGYFSTKKTSTSDNSGLLPSQPSTRYHLHDQHQAKAKSSSFFQHSPIPQNIPLKGRDASQPCCSNVVDLQNEDKKTFSLSSVNTAMPNSSQKRTQKRIAPGPVAGWPPIRSIRKNLASGSSSKLKLPPESQQYQLLVPDKATSRKPIDNSGKGLFVKINMDGVPIGRKVDINAYSSYEKLSTAVEELFRDLLAATQRDSSTGGTQNKQEKVKKITGPLDGSGEHALVYEDNEGDKILVGDVPWRMFVSTAKRLRVVKSSDLSVFSHAVVKSEQKSVVP